MSDFPLITIRNAQRKLRIDLASLQEFAKRALPLCLALPAAESGGIAALGEISISLVSDRRMAALHRQFMNVAGPTDVLTFQHGEIVISAETARENAARFGSSSEDEIKLYLVHGLLHLLGFNDEKADEARVMELAQTRVFSAARSA